MLAEWQAVLEVADVAPPGEHGGELPVAFVTPIDTQLSL